MEWWTGIATIALAVIAFVQFWIQFYFSKRQSKDTLGAVDRTIEAQRQISREEIALRFYFTMAERFDNNHLKQSRHALAFHLKGNGSNEQIQEDVLNFFEDLGALFRQGRVDEQLTYDTFSYYVKGWWAACRSYVTWLRGRKRDTSLFSDFEFLADRMRDREAKERSIALSEVVLNGAGVEEFLDEEITL
ncbi:MAG: DUF4760 domain-containing protein [Candidatus Binatus sp.]|jgi:hypothetical protein|uniref:DUF4760 domain-containing protein n=1 Tax=Candidatus Binatus sp. TaxID=2811406 RepID=UPI003C72CED9